MATSRLSTSSTTENVLVAGTVVAVAVLIVTIIAAWVTHVLVCLQTANLAFLIAGALLAPIGVVHGVGIWFGAF
jgi:hypothetical protein